MLGAGIGSMPASADHQENYAEIEVHGQRTGGTTVRVARTYVEAEGFITIHTMDLIDEQDGPGTIVGVSRPLEPGEHLDEVVKLFHGSTGYSPEFEDQNRLERDQKLVAVPHRDMNHTGEFEFTGGHPVDIPFTDGPQTETTLPVDGAVNDTAMVTIGRPDDGPGNGRGRKQRRGELADRGSSGSPPTNPAVHGGGS